MTADTSGHDHHKQDLTIHARDYAGFLNLLKWTVIAVAIIATAVILIISN